MGFVLTKNNIYFNVDHYRQVSGTSMSTNMAPAYTNVFMGKFEEDFIYTYHTPPTVWTCFIDDCSYTWMGSLSSLEKFIVYPNTCNPNIKFIFEASQVSIHFLDTTVILNEGHITNRTIKADRLTSVFAILISTS